MAFHDQLRKEAKYITDSPKREMILEDAEYLQELTNLVAQESKPKQPSKKKKLGKG